MQSYWNDEYIKFEYDPQNNKYAFLKEAIGPTATIGLEEKTDATDENCVWVSSTGNDSTGDGTESSPYATLLKAISECTTTRPDVMVDESSGIWDENISSYSNQFFNGVYKPESSTLKLSIRTIDYTPSDANSVFVKSDGDDDTGDGTESSPYATLDHAFDQVTATKTKVVILDSESYTATPWEFAGSLVGLYADIGCAPTVQIQSTYASRVPKHVKNPTAFGFDSGAYYNGRSVGVLPNGNFVVCVDDVDDYKVMLYIIDEDGNIQNTITVVTLSASDFVSTMKVLPNGNVVVVYYEDIGSLSSIHFVVYNQSGSVVRSDTAISADTATGGKDIDVACFTDSSFTAMLWASSVSYWHVSSSYSVSSLVTRDLYGTNLWPRIESFGDDRLIMFYLTSDGYSTGSYSVQFDICDKTMSTTYVSEAYFTTSGHQLRYQSPLRLASGNIAVVYLDQNGGSWNEVYYCIVESDGTISSSTQIENTTNMVHSLHMDQYGDDAFIMINIRDMFFCPENLNSDEIAGLSLGDSGSFPPLTVDVAYNPDNDRIVYAGYSASDTHYGVMVPPVDTGVTVSVDSVIDGVTLNGQLGKLNSMITLNSYDLVLKHCEIKNVQATSIDTDGINGYAIDGDGDLDIDNCSIHDNDAGIYVETDIANIQRTEFYRNSNDYAVHIDGAAESAGDISIINCTLFDNYAAIRLENNNGSNETLKNNIVHDNNVYGINSDTGVTQSYGICTDANENVTDGSFIVSANPLFVNDGYVVPGEADLQLKRRSLGNEVDSPAISLADDGDDAGAHHVHVIGDVTSWTAITVQKPRKMPIIYKPVGVVSNVMQNGDVDTDNTGWTTVFAIRFDATLNNEFDDIVDMIMAASNRVRIYPDPTTYPNQYAVYRLEYDDVSASPTELFKLGRTGVQGVTLKFKRQYSS